MKKSVFSCFSILSHGSGNNFTEILMNAQYCTIHGKGAISSRRLDFYLLVHGSIFISLLPPIETMRSLSDLRDAPSRIYEAPQRQPLPEPNNSWIFKKASQENFSSIFGSSI
ncbi:hypothetical protein TNCV_4505841 [Trichonephila clavipes]|nr:hypothetical protein TNCV_4505841 [Trichonephila clavipes]